MLKTITSQLLDELTTAACTSPRRRMNHNLHEAYDDPCQRLLNAIEPGSYIRPHRHHDPPKPECFVAVRGRMAVLLFRDDGQIESVVPITAGGKSLGVDIPAGAWHAILSLESGSVFFETKPGPYAPLSGEGFAPWAPAEGSEAVPAYLAELEQAVQRFLGAQR